MKFIMDNIKWKGGSARMYEAVLKETPVLFRGLVKNSVEEWITRNNIQEMTEELVFKAVQELAPPSLAGKIRPELEKLRS